MKTITIQVPDGCDVQIVKKEEKKETTIKTYQDLVDKKIKFSGFQLNTYSQIKQIYCYAHTENMSVASSEKVAKSMLAMAMISQLMPYYGGAISDKEWTNDESKYVIVKIGGQIQTDDFYRKYHFPAFHTKEQRDDFLKYNERLVKDYLMID